MKFAAILIVLLNAALLVPASYPYFNYLVLASLVLALLVLAISITTMPMPDPLPVVAEAVKPAPVLAAPKPDPQAEVVMLLGVLQEKGRLIDFLMEDITPYSDAEVGSVARSVHQGCKAALNEHFQIESVSREGEGAVITVPAGYPADEIRLTGNLSGEAPFSGTVVHKGWRTKSVKLPRVLHADHLPVIAPAQVEVK